MENCFYCNKLAKNKQHFYSHTMYQIISINKFIAGYKYNSKEVLVPRCKSCYKKHLNFFLTFAIPTFIITLAIMIYLFYSNPNNEYNELSDWLKTIFICSIISVFAAGFITKLLEYLFFERIYRIPKEDDIKQFGPIKELISLNWQFHKKDPSVAEEEHIAKDSPYYKKS